jgi:hypothetical protein
MHLTCLSLRRLRQTGVLAAALASLWPARLTAEPIRFSGRTGPAVVQEFDRREPLLPTEASLSGKAKLQPELPLSAFMPPSQAMTPTTGLTRRQLEAQDQKRNWLLQSPETILRQAERQDEANRDPLSRDDSPKSAASRFLENSDTTADKSSKPRNETPSDKGRRERDSRGQDTSRESQGNELGIRPGDARNTLDTRQVGSSPGMDGPSLFTAGATRAGSYGRMVNDARERERQRENAASLEAFQRSFNNPWAQPATSSGGGNPLAGNVANGLSAPGGFMGNDLARRVPGANLGQTTRGPMNLGPVGKDGFDPSNPLNYGAPDTVMQPSAAPTRSAPAPVKLEAPRRKF